jgi:selenocysteine-specific elongation factor
VAATPEPAEPRPLSAAALELERVLLAAADRPPRDRELAQDAELAELREHGRALRLDRDTHIHRQALDAVADKVAGIIQAEGSITLARLRDELDTSRRYAQALLETLDAERVTLRMPDDSRVLRRSAEARRDASRMQR